MRTALLVTLIAYGIPLLRLRGRWRATVYRDDSWRVQIQPRFGKDIAALFSNRYFVTDAERQMARRYRWYVLGYTALVLAVVLS